MEGPAAAAGAAPGLAEAAGPRDQARRGQLEGPVALDVGIMLSD